MAFAHDATLQLVAQVQLEELIAFKAQYPEQDVWPPYIHDLEAVRPHLELVAVGGVVFNEEAINARVNKGFFAAEYDLEELRAPSPSATAPTRQVYGPVTAAAGTTDEFRVDGHDVITTPPRVTPAASSVEVAYQNAFARLDAALRARDDSLSDIYSDDNAGAPPKILSELETVHSNNSKVSKVTETALAFLSQTDVGHIIEAQAQSSSQSISSREAEHGTPSKDSATHDVESVRIEAESPAPTTHLHHDEVDEDLISFDEDPTRAGTIPITIADGFPPTSTFAKEVEEVESGNVALDVNPTTDHSVDSGTELAVKTSEDVPFSTKGTTSAPDDGLTVAAEAQCAAISITGDDTVTPPASVHEDDNVVKCFKCTNDYVENVITCACNHQYCADCLNDMVKASIHGPTPFPPVCCEIAIPVDINSSVFEKNTLYDFLWKKFGAFDVGEQGGVGERGGKSLPSLPSLPSLSIEEKTEYSFSGFGAEEAYNETKCHLCHKTIEKGLYCPDCCYQCNNSRAACKCDWWDGRQRREKGEAIVKAPSFQTAQPQVAPFRGQRKQFGGIFERYNGTRRAETQNGACQHPLMKQVKLSGRCFDCQHMLPAFLWQCTRCKYSVCKHCGKKRGIFSH
ncbi:hypothetical protein BFJ68_g14542 [Fusarium oxysporum]|uniref:RING-type domain-containing protein n=1 Tax=Fusarium oxysporum TaxID=5507 RepID=A0A420PUG9_FUSOX|nr:hypothetical protein BFJ67_g14537 [Fusarium oxysporum f. sp. cepae]RKK96015.1 hypothetical protein BFJ68_g14542 [Fusarium oxysporum]